MIERMALTVNPRLTVNNCLLHLTMLCVIEVTTQNLNVRSYRSTL